MTEDQVEKKKYPLSVFFIIGNEFCERFSFYGMKAILILYFTSKLSFGEDTATSLYHGFTMTCYFTTVFGALISDSLLGKFRTVLYLSLVYASGNIILAVTSISLTNSAGWGALVGLLLIALGTGGIKPCVAAFGGDQFEKGQEKYLETFFSLFYFAINAGGLISLVVTPVLKGEVSCFNDKCYPLAFGVPAVLMIISLVLFILGKFCTGYVIHPPEGNILVKVVGCIGHAIKNRCSRKQQSCDHWLDYADDKYDITLINDIKGLFNVIILFLPVPVFWALFDQQGSRWTLQALRMDGMVGSFNIKPDMIQFINPVLILILIPIFQFGIYPLFSKLKMPLRPLQRMTIGMIFAAAAFVIAIFIQIKINTTLPPTPSSGNSNLYLINMASCSVKIHLSNRENFTLNAWESKSNLEVDSKELACSVECWNNSLSERIQQIFQNLSSHITVLVSSSDRGLTLTQFQDPDKKPNEVNTLVKMVSLLQPTNYHPSSVIKITSKNDQMSLVLKDQSQTEFSIKQIGNYILELLAQDGSKTIQSETLGKVFEAKNGAASYLIFHRHPDTKDVTFHQFDRFPANSLSIFLQIPQYICITIGEVLFSITGIEFAYAEAPASMKSVLQACWLLTVAFGNIIVIIVAESSYISNQVYEFLLFVILMFLDMFVFAVLAYNYKPVVRTTKQEKLDIINGLHQPNALESKDERL